MDSKVTTNAQVLRSMLLTGSAANICEWNSDTNRPAMLAHNFHGLATATVGARDGKFRVCADCAMAMRRGQKEVA